MKALGVYRPAPFLLAAVLFLASGCRQIDGPHEAAEIPMYTQLLLKGDVRNRPVPYVPCYGKIHFVRSDKLGSEPELIG